MSETILSGIKSLIMAAFITTFGVYTGAALIALFASITRLAYTSDEFSVKLFGKFFVMSLAITMTMVHVGSLRGWDDDLTIIVSGITAFLCRESLELVVNSKDVAYKYIVQRFTGSK